jgi:F-type H+-transporting ATPase subunit b
MTMIGPIEAPATRRLLFALTLIAFVLALSAQSTTAQDASTAPSSQQTDQSTPQPNPSNHHTAAGELVQETRESTGEAEDNINLTHAAPIQWLARKTGLSVHQAHLVALTLNFVIVVVIVVWAARKYLPGMFRNRSASIQQALEEARAASQDANRRLADIENRLRQLDVEIGRMQANAENEAAAEEVRIKAAAEEDIRKVVLAAEQEISAAAKQARTDLTNHTAGLAIALASKQINVDSNTDQVLVRSFASKLTSRNNDGKDDQ